MSVEKNGEEIDRRPLSVSEIINLRRMINEYFYKQRFRKAIKVWLFTLGTIASTTIGALTIWKEIVERFLK